MFGTRFAKLEGNMIVLGFPCSSHSSKHGTVCGMKCSCIRASIDVGKTLNSFAKLEGIMIVLGLFVVAMVLGKVPLVA